MTISFLRKITRCYQRTEVGFTVVCAGLGFFFAYPAYGIWGQTTYDGACSGVWGNIAVHCYLPDIGYSAIAIGLPLLLFRQKLHHIAWLFVGVFVGICMAFGTLSGRPLVFFIKSLYIPSLFGIWISLWTIVTMALGASILAKHQEGLRNG